MFPIEGQSNQAMLSVALTLLFVTIVAVLALSYLIFRYRATLMRNRQFAQLLRSLDQSRKRNQSIDWAFVDSQIQSIPWLWTQVSEFFEQCWTEDGVRFNNEQAGQYLREEEMYPRAYRWMESIPERLPGIGILGTFIGIVIGLLPLATALGGAAGGDGASQGVAEQAAEMASATSQLVMGLLISFTTSVFALLFSIILGYMQRGVNGALDAHRLRLIEWLNTNVQRVVTPQVLTLLLNEQRAQSEAQAERAANTVQLVEDKVLPVLEAQLEQQRHILDKVHESIEAAIQSSGLVSAIDGMASTIAKTQADGIGELLSKFQERMGHEFGNNFNSLGDSLDSMVRSNESYQQNMGELIDSLSAGIKRQLEAAGVVEQTVRASSESVDKVLAIVEGLEGGAHQIQGASQQMNDAIANQRQALSEQQQLNASVLDAMQAQSARWTTEREASAEAYAQLASQFSALSTTLDKLIQWHDRVHGELNAQVVTWREAVNAQGEISGRQLKAASLIMQGLRASRESVDKVLAVVKGFEGGALQIQGASQQMNDAIANQRQALSEQQQLNASVLDAMQAQSAQWTFEREASAEAYDKLSGQFSSMSIALANLIQWHDRVHGELNDQVTTWRSAIEAQSQLSDNQLKASDLVVTAVRASSESVDKVLSVVEGLDGGAQQIQGAAQQMNDAIANQRQALSEQQQLNASVLDAMQAQSARWTTEREASAEAYAQLASQFSALSTTLDKLIQWHDRVHGELNAQVVTWRSAIDAQSQLTGTVHEERKQWSTLVHSLGDASTNLRHITDSLGRWASTMQGLADTMQTDLTALSQTQQSGHDGLAAIGDKLQRIGSSMGDSWENYATIASSLSESLPDVATLLEGLTQAVSTQQQIVIEARTVAETFKETGATQAQLKDGLTQLVTASSDANRALVPTAKSLGDAASTLDKLTLRLQAQDDETRRTSQQLSSAVKTMSERDAAFKSQWTGVTQALERTSAGFQKSVSEYENSVSSTVEKTFKQFDTELASSVDKLKGAVQAMHGLVERIDAMVEELTDR